MNFTVYKASAGAGKTYTLVKEYLKLSLPDQKPDHYRSILAITFTNKAASEMKERVIRALKEISSKEGASGTSAFLQTDLLRELNIEIPVLKLRCRQVLEHMLHNYSDLSICTIDKFTHKIIRTFAHDLRLPVNFEIEMDERNLISKAVDLLISKAGIDEALTKVLLDFSESKFREEKDWQIERDLKDFAGGMFSDEAIPYLEKIRNIELPEFIEIKEKIRVKISDFESTLSDIGNEALSLVKTAGIELSAFAGGANGICKYFSYLATKRSDKYIPGKTVEKNIAEDRWYSGKATASEKSSIDEIKIQLGTLFARACELTGKYLEDYILLKLIYRYIYSLMVLKEIDRIIFELKKENNILHISDFNKIIATIIANEPAPFIYERIGEKYRHYLIDEFQDTSVLQWQNLLPLLDNSLAGGNFNMIVGDGKQSIYRWRGGDVEQFALLPKLYRNHDSPLSEEREASLVRNFTEKPLKSNFRSKMEIVDFNNKFFETVSSGLTDDYRPIYANTAQEFNSQNTGGYVQMEFINEKNTGEENLETVNCSKILDIIRENLADGHSLKDIAILFRKNREASLVAKFLMENGIQVISSESLLLCNSSEVNFIVSFLSYLNNTQDDVARAHILNHLFFNLNEGESSGFHTVLKKAGKETAKLDKTLCSFGYVFSPASLLKYSLYECCEEILRIFKLEPQVNGYLRFFMEHVHNYTCRYSSGIAGFLSWWNEKKNNLSVVVPQGMDAVNIMTIHKSKGLEFPVVIFPFANWKVSNGKSSFWIDFPEGSDIPVKTAVVPVSKDLEQTIFAPLYLEEVNKSQLDHLNLLYVAMTRPEERLYIISSISPHKTLSRYFVSFLESAGKWDNEDKIYSFGSKVPKEQASVPSIGCSVDIKNLVSERWDQKIRISGQAPLRWENREDDSARDYGNFLHYAVSKLKSSDGILNILEAMLFEGEISLEEKDELTYKLQEIITHPVSGEWFKPENSVRNEKEILLPEGKSYRPDKVVFRKNETLIIDFKTGLPNESHKEQILNYSSALEEMGYPGIKKYLFYTRNLELVEV